MRASCARGAASHPYVVMRQDALLCRVIECLRLLVPADARPPGVRPMDTGWLSDMAELPDEMGAADVLRQIGPALGVWGRG